MWHPGFPRLTSSDPGPAHPVRPMDGGHTTRPTAPCPQAWLPRGASVLLANTSEPPGRMAAADLPLPAVARYPGGSFVLAP
jgi:hypothetical protein